MRTAPFSVAGHPLSNVCIALLSTLPPSIRYIRVRLLRVRSTAYLRDTESFGLGALDDMLADCDTIGSSYTSINGVSIFDSIVPASYIDVYRLI